MKKALSLLSLFVFSHYAMAQFPKTFPEDGLDVNVSVSYTFMNNESQQERSVFKEKFTGLVLEQGFNVVDVVETPSNITEVEKVKIKKRNDSLGVKYIIVPLNYGMYNSVMIVSSLNNQMKRYTDRASFQAALELFKKDVDKFKATHPSANQVAYENTMVVLEVEDNGEDEPYENADFSNKVIFIDELPADLSTQTLLVLLFDDFDVSKEDSALISAEELAKRKKQIAKYKKKNEQFKMSLKEYPYPVTFAYMKDLKELTSKHPYQLVDRYRRESVMRPKRNSSGHIVMVSKRVLFHNYCIKDHRKTDTFYRLPSWIDCDREMEYGCLNKFVKTILKQE